MNAELSRSNEELEAFAFVASHDLREPLRQIETFGTLLRADPDRSRAAWQQCHRAGSRASRRLRGACARLINDLTEYARLGRHAQPFAPTDLNSKLHNVCADLSAIIEETQATILAGSLACRDVRSARRCGRCSRT